MLSVLLAVAIAFVAARTYQLWQEGPQDLHLPKPGKGKSSLVVEEPKEKPRRAPLADSVNIIDKNLFDPERGSSETKRAETSSVDVQRVRSLILIGTAILGNSRYAILKEPSNPRRVSSKKSRPSLQGPMRLKLGDTVEGFRLSEIHERKVVFTKGAFKVEVALDFLRKIDDVKEKVKTRKKSTSRVAPRIPKKKSPDQGRLSRRSDQ
ncbi:MAG: hypothetical protein O7B35_12750 [Deltaproteobacteria bacterium]|nr:hypothetical protein [Deltaproteobacteria bacterium]